MTKQTLKKLVGIPIYPVLRYFGPRFDNVHSRLDRTNHLLEGMASRLDELDSMGRRLDEFEQRIVTDVETTLELFVTLQRTAGILEQRIGHLQELLSSEFKPVSDLDSQAPTA